MEFINDYTDEEETQTESQTDSDHKLESMDMIPFDWDQLSEIPDLEEERPNQHVDHQPTLVASLQRGIRSYYGFGLTATQAVMDCHRSYHIEHPQKARGYKDCYICELHRRQYRLLFDRTKEISVVYVNLFRPYT